MGKIFIKEDSTAFLTEDSNKKPRYERNIRTFEIKKKKDKFIIYEKNRKKKDKKIKTIKAVKGRTQKSIISDIQNDKIVINSKQEDIQKTKYGELRTIQTTYKSRVKTAFKQLVCLVRVSDSSRMIIDYYIGYSRKIPSAVPNDSEWKRAEWQCKDMAISKFVKDYGLPKGDDDIDNSYFGEDSGKLNKYGKEKELGVLKAEIIQMRYQIYRQVYK